MEREIRDKNNLIIGWCRDIGGQIQAIHIKKGYVGNYIKSSNITFDKNGRIYSYDDATSSLVRDAERD